MDSPVVERRSRKIAPSDLVVEEVSPEDLNDDEEERNQLRIQEETNRQSNSMHSKRMSLTDKSLSDRNVSEHFQSCIQLAAENKITAKNAFNFKLIDLLYTMLKKKEQFSNFTEVTSSLDAGVKIYSCRVDNVHSDTMKMATSISLASHQSNENDNLLEANEADPSKREKKRVNRKAKKLTIASNPDLIKRTSSIVEEGTSQKILTNETLIINSAIFDVNRVSWHLNTNLNFLKSFEPLHYDSSSVPLDFLDNCQDAIICKTFDRFQFGDESSCSHDLSRRQDVINAFEYELPTVDMTSAFENDVPANDEDIDMNYTADEEKAPEIQYFSKIMSSSAFVNDISKLISTETSEYLYFNSQTLNKKWIFKNMQHWNPIKKRNEQEEKRTRSEKKEKIDFKNFNGLNIFDDEYTSTTTTTNIFAPREKFLITPITHFSVNEFFRLKIWREMFVIPSKNLNEEQPSDLEETINDYNYENPNDSQHFIPEQYEDDYCEGVNDAASDIHEAIEKNAFIGENLVEIPNKVSKIQLPYMVKDKSVNMKNLKTIIWNKLEAPDERIMSPVNQDSISFTSVCKVILVDEKKTTDEELSVPILFNAILQLANDKSLYLFNPAENDVSDFIVAVSSFAS